MTIRPKYLTLLQHYSICLYVLQMIPSFETYKPTFFMHFTGPMCTLYAAYLALVILSRQQHWVKDINCVVLHYVFLSALVLFYLWRFPYPFQKSLLKHSQ